MNTLIEYSGKTHVICDKYFSFTDFKYAIHELTHIPIEYFKLYLHQKILHDLNFKQYDLKGQTVKLSLCLVGGKGGFGAKMKNEGSKKNRGNNTKFSRDLSGRRLDFAAIKKDCIDFYKKKIEEDKIVEEERKKMKVMEMTIDQANRSGKLDKRHKEQLQANAGDIMEAIKIGLAHKKQGNSISQKDNQQKVNSEENNKINQSLDESNKEVQKEQNENQKQPIPQNNKQQIEGDSDIQDDGEPFKRVKLNQKPIENEKQISNQQIAPPMVCEQKPKPIFLSAADKLKSLFKR